MHTRGDSCAFEGVKADSRTDREKYLPALPSSVIIISPVLDTFINWNDLSEHPRVLSRCRASMLRQENCVTLKLSSARGDDEEREKGLDEEAFLRARHERVTSERKYKGRRGWRATSIAPEISIFRCRGVASPVSLFFFPVHPSRLVPPPPCKSVGCALQRARKAPRSS